eukprot:1161725-Pelagomonas_calceolata.AAC.2
MLVVPHPNSTSQSPVLLTWPHVLHVSTCAYMQLVLADPEDACSPLNGDYTNKVVLFTRQGCDDLGAKGSNVESSNAVAVTGSQQPATIHAAAMAVTKSGPAPLQEHSLSSAFAHPDCSLCSSREAASSKYPSSLPALSGVYTELWSSNGQVVHPSSICAWQWQACKDLGSVTLLAAISLQPLHQLVEGLRGCISQRGVKVRQTALIKCDKMRVKCEFDKVRRSSH